MTGRVQQRREWILEQRKAGVRVKQIASALGVHQTTISNMAPLSKVGEPYAKNIEYLNQNGVFVGSMRSALSGLSRDTMRDLMLDVARSKMTLSEYLVSLWEKSRAAQ